MSIKAKLLESELKIVTKQRDELLTALKAVMESHGELSYDVPPRHIHYIEQEDFDKAWELITSIEGKAK